MTVLEQLGGPAERRRSATAREWAVASARRRRRAQRDGRALPARRAAVRGAARRRASRTTVSSPSSRCARSRWRRWRRGPVSCCGTSDPARAASPSSGAAAVPGCAAVAFERDERSAQADRRRTRWRSASTSRCTVDAPEAFDGVPRAPAVDLRRRWLTQPGLLDACWEQLPGGGRLVANVVTVESEAVLAQWYSRHRRRAAPVSALPRRAGRRLHRLASRDAGHPVGGDEAMTVYFIGAGPGAADLITVRGQRLLQRCPVCLYAGSIMPDDLLALCPPDAKVVDTGPLTLEQIVAELADAARRRARRRAPALRRPVDLQRAGRAVPPPRRRRGRLRDRARRTGLRRRGRRAGP